MTQKKGIPEKDILEKVLLAYSDVFADCENALAYGGEQMLQAEELIPAPTESFYPGAEGLHSQFCDVSSFWVKAGEIKVQFIIGNETGLEGRQVLRKASYQGGAYRIQLGSGKPVYPVVGMVIDWTHKGARIPLTLHELLLKDGASRDILAKVDDVKLEVYHMNNLSEEVRKRFTSDLGFVVDYLNEGGFERRREQKIIHAEALCQMMAALTKDTRFTDLVTELLEKQKEGRDIIMCEYIDMLEARGAARLAKLIQILLKEKKIDEIEAVSGSREKRQELYRHYGI